jgi:hypothetical protein
MLLFGALAGLISLSAAFPSTGLIGGGTGPGSIARRQSTTASPYKIYTIDQPVSGL